VDRAAARQDEHALAPQQLQCASDLRVMGGIEMRLYRQLRHRHIGLRIDQQERIPGAVIEPAAGIDGAADAGLVEQLNHAAGERRRPRRRIPQPIELVGKAVEIMDRFRRRRSADRRTLGLPVGGDAENGLGAFDRASESGDEVARRDILEHQHGRAVGEEQGGQLLCVHASRSVTLAQWVIAPREQLK
jgi:hypothetical protein